jgi:hypothetical protein
MHRQAKRGRPISLKVVALITAIQVRRAGELALMLVLVAIRALRKFHPIERVFALGEVAFRALDRGVLLYEGVCGGCVLLYSERCRFKSLHVVAGCAVPFVGTLQELAIVLILVTVETSLEGQRLLEVAASVAA